MPRSEHANIKVRARAVDMLGRQQIAGIPTAIHELFKNAYDAFARRVEVDLFVRRRTLILRDDGFGMTEKEFRDRWLTLGTESKVGQTEHTAIWLGEYGAIPRRMLGEKGIGRLAIALVGPSVLVLTRAYKNDGLHDLVCSLIYWPLFEIAGLDLHLIDIPIIGLPGGTLPEKKELEYLVGAILQNVENLADQIPPPIREQAASDLELMSFSPKAVLEALDKGKPQEEHLSLAGEGYGTYFIVRPYDSVLDADLAVEEQGRTSTLERLLVGFGNTMFSDIEAPPIKAAFRQHRIDGEVLDFIGERAFFTPDEYRTADHIIEGKFDEYGQFKGEVKVYDQPPVPYTLNWPGARGSNSLCGPFEIRCGYIMGWQHQSLLTAEEWLRMIAKLDRIGGLYIYRDGVRVLPYGDSNYDFLNIERRRTYAAKDWFFSYRRMFGAVLISSTHNRALQEKAGREGFRETLAYRQFRDMLENLFISLAKDFFRPKAPLGEEFNRMKEELESRNELLKKREKLVSARKEKFRAALDNFFGAVESGKPGAETQLLKERFDRQFNFITELDDPDKMGVEFNRLEAAIHANLEELRQRFRVSRPQGIGLTKQMISDWHAYRKVYEELEANQFRHLSSYFDGRLAELLEKRGAALNRRILLRQALDTRQQSIRRMASQSEKEAREGLTRARESITRGITASIIRLRAEVETVLSDFERTEVAQLDGEAIVSMRSFFERRLESAAERETLFLGRIREQMDAFSESVTAGVLPDDITSALEDKNKDLQEELEESLHWAQVGMSLGVVQHEFNGIVRNIKQRIHNLGPWARGTPGLRNITDDLRAGFSHLEEYLRLFAPLDRRLRRQKVELSGDEIRGYVLSIFEDRFERHGIKLIATDDFRKFAVSVFPSTLLPVFINLVDNACYWLRESSPQQRWICLDLHPEGMIVENGGPGIENRYAERIFEFGFTTKPNGRGMGLSIARRALRHAGMDLMLLNPGRENPPRFLIKLASEQQSS